jgi:hypothetical protein
LNGRTIVAGAWGDGTGAGVPDIVVTGAGVFDRGLVDETSATGAPGAGVVHTQDVSPEGEESVLGPARSSNSVFPPRCVTPPHVGSAEHAFWASSRLGNALHAKLHPEIYVFGIAGEYWHGPENISRERIA